jgi:phospholipid:diacylglycerol acyltransferase
MANLRRRIFGTGANDDDSPSTTRAPSPAPTRKHSTSDGTSSSLGEQLVSVPFAKLERLNSYVTEVNERKTRPKTGLKRRNFWIFGLGGLFGLVVAGFFASSADVLDLSYLSDMNLDSIIDVLPAGLVRDAHELQVRSVVSCQAYARV